MKEPVNIITDSACVAGVVQRLERSFLKQINHELLFNQMKELWLLLQ